MDLPALSDFILVARHGGFGRAARAAGRPKATLSRRVSELEAALGLRLFERGARTLKLTEEGRALFERSGRLLTELEETVGAIASGGERVRGRLRISAPMLFSQVAMGRIVAGFVREYPEVAVEVTTEDRAVDMVEEGYDLVIRANPDPDESLVGRAFLHDRLVVVASPSVPRPHGGEAVPAVVRPGAGRAGWAVKGEAGYAVRPVLAMSSLIMARDAVRAGAGAAQLPLSLVTNDLADGTLVQWAEVDVPDVALWALYPSRRLLSPRVSAFLDFLKRAFPKGSHDELAAFVGR